MKKTKLGFTLIELLIVIALLGALAVGLLAALDPFEQLKKGTDTGVRNTVSEIHGGIIRYYAITSSMPWTGTLDWDDASSGYTTIGIPLIVSSGELKEDFSTLAKDQLQNIRVGGGEQSATVCFNPASKSFRTDLNTKFSDVGVASDDVGEICDPATKDPSLEDFPCWWCIM